MSKRRMIELAACGTGMLLYAGAALAITGPADGSGARATIQPSAAPQAAAEVSAQAAAGASAASTQAAPTPAPAKIASSEAARPVHRAGAQLSSPDAIGREVVDAQGETVGPVREVVGDKVVFPVSDAMGFAAHNVAVKWSDIDKLGSGSGGMLRVRMSADDLRNLPAYEGHAGT